MILIKTKKLRRCYIGISFIYVVLSRGLSFIVLFVCRFEFSSTVDDDETKIDSLNRFGRVDFREICVGLGPTATGLDFLDLVNRDFTNAIIGLLNDIQQFNFIWIITKRQIICVV